MRKSMLVATAVLVLALAALPVAAAGFQVLKDQFYPRLGTGQALLLMDNGTLAEIWYRDMDGTRTYTAPDTRLRVRYLKGPVVLPGPMVLKPSRG